MNRKIIGLTLLSLSVLTLTACGNRSDKSANKSDIKVAMVTNQGGVDDKSFNQSAWEGLQKWGKKKGLTKGNGFDYFQSSNESDHANNLDTAASSGYNLIFGIGFGLHDTIEKVSENNKDVKYVIVDDIIKGKENVAAYLAGIAAAKTTKTKTVGFIGGMEGVVVKRFEAGFKAGVKSIDPAIKVAVSYAGSFTDAAKGKTIAATQYATGVDVIYQAAGGTGAGIFSEAKTENETRKESNKVWVIGVDRDQSQEGNYVSKDGKKANFVLASTIKEVGKSLQSVAELTEKKQYPGGKVTVFGLKDSGVDIKEHQLSSEGSVAVKKAKEDIVSGKIQVPMK
ncbi:TPA: BMP family protein [Streptococcus agalactiae]|nr:BMP family protein [Streptococcus agalactiae]HEN7619996.1 BMP family protein [Streptococcus agalactiae]